MRALELPPERAVRWPVPPDVPGMPTDPARLELAMPEAAGLAGRGDG
ncbi:hypothetical protein O1Q96_23230 [Streptomyces sp. Qhu-G9]|nr:hypothetical protein [Streptomyces aurantiacus]WAU86674.1 hypothetical protein O1Q96_23230 [Streptomyces aurantiacus]